MPNSKQRRRRRRKRDRRGGGGTPQTTSRTREKTGLSTTQTRAGNQAVTKQVKLLQTHFTDEELLERKLLPPEHPQYPRQIKLRLRRRRERLAYEQSSYASRLWNALPSLGSWSWSAAEEEEEEEELGVRFNQVETPELDDLTHEHEGDTGHDFWATGTAVEDEDEDEGDLVDKVKDLLPSEVVITLASAAGKAEGTSLGDVSGSAKLQQNHRGDYTGALKGKVEGTRGSAEGELNASYTAEQLAGDGKLEMKLGHGGEYQSSTLNFTSRGAKLSGSGKLETFAGGKFESSGSGSYDTRTGDVAAKAKFGGLLGTSVEGTTKIRILAGDTELGAFEGTAGLTFGVGGQYTGTLAWTTGSLVFGAGGKLSFGVGASYGFKVELKTQNLLKTVGSAIWDWLSWLNEGATEEDFWL